MTARFLREDRVAKLRHIAFIVKEPKKLYEFYHHLFGLEQVRLSPSGSIHVIDGLFNLAFLQQAMSEEKVANTHRVDGHEIDQRPGINPFGFLVGNVESVLSRLDDTIQRGESPQNGRPAEMRIIDPWGNKFDISSKGFLGREEKRLPGIRHVVVQTATPDRAAEFYTSVLDLREIGRDRDGTVLLSDGDVTLSLTATQTIGKPGIQYFGVQVKDWSSTAARFREIGVDLSGRSGAERQARVTDPEGNLFVVSETGWPT